MCFLRLRLYIDQNSGNLTSPCSNLTVSSTDVPCSNFFFFLIQDPIQVTYSINDLVFLVFFNMDYFLRLSFLIVTLLESTRHLNCYRRSLSLAFSDGFLIITLRLCLRKENYMCDSVFSVLWIRKYMPVCPFNGNGTHIFKAPFFSFRLAPQYMEFPKPGMKSKPELGFFLSSS